MFKNFKCVSMVLLFGFMATPAAADDTEAAKKYVDNVASKVMQILNSDQSESQKSTTLQSMISNYVDIKWIGKFVLGQNWRRATPEQQSKYLSNYEDFILKSYASRFIKHSGVGYKMLDSRADTEGRYTVRMSIDSGKQPVLVDYKLLKTGKNFKIYDLTVEGVSLITTQRSEFNSIVQSKGMDYLIEQLANKSGQLASNSK